MAPCPSCKKVVAAKSIGSAFEVENGTKDAVCFIRWKPQFETKTLFRRLQTFLQQNFFATLRIYDPTLNLRAGRWLAVVPTGNCS